MEKQINMDNQNIQQMGQNSVNQSLPTQEKSKVNYWMISTVALLALFLGTISLYFLNLDAQRKLSNRELSPTTVKSNIPTKTPATTDVSNAIPLKNNLYLGIYQGEDALFLTTDYLSGYFEKGIKKTSQTIGQLTFMNGGARHPIDYSKLENPKRIFPATEKVGHANNFAFNDEKSFIYVSLNYRDNPAWQTSKLYQINLNNLASEELWVHDVGDDKYASDDPYTSKGDAVVEKVFNDEYLTLGIYSCDGCESLYPRGIVLLNIQTKKEKYLGYVGDIKIDLSANTVSYKKINSFKEPCQPSTGEFDTCDAGQRTVYKPSGQVFTQKLP